MAIMVENGVPHAKFFDTVDPDDSEYIRQLLRPPAVTEDVRLMEQRGRVTLVLHSGSFRNELDKTIASHMKSGQLSGSLLALKEIADVLTPHTRLGFSAFTRCRIRMFIISFYLLGATMPVVPVNDLRTGEKPVYSKFERMIRCKLASTFRLSDLFRWNVNSLNPITVRLMILARLARESEHYLVNPQGLLFHEITASSLIKLDIKGTIIDQGSTVLGIDRPGWMLHAAIYESRPDIRCIIYLNTPATIAVSSCRNSNFHLHLPIH
ncbi:unnamed protein product [Protopolystoma xenopodis]|uniref:Class II aldolase/adducin N-terminal domain-containing protein n=1 Tax=Protopolystoma xenopodis TaxID=117903 RepID=A0A3S4ZS18_9PLAT|nr:unnamed protein product [Protopolystoma xenopodis]